MSEPAGHEEQHEGWQVASIDAMGWGQRDQHGSLGERFRREQAGGHVPRDWLLAQISTPVPSLPGQLIKLGFRDRP